MTFLDAVRISIQKTIPEPPKAFYGALDQYFRGIMEFSTIVILALIQGVTEFLPVSSSGHLILLPQLTGTEDQGQAMDVAVHVGTLFAVMLYFWRDVWGLVVGTLNLLTGRFQTQNARLVLLLILATIPVIFFGLILKLSGLSDGLRDIKVIGWTMLIFGIVLYWADLRNPTTRTADSWTVRDAVIMGFWQAIALIPGTSRSGATITASRMLGFDRRDGAKLAMLMSIPTIAASGILIGADAYSTVGAEQIRDLMIAAVLAFLAALVALVLMMQLLRSVSYTPYVIYRVVLGIVLLFIAYT